jgi:transposase
MTAAKNPGDHIIPGLIEGIPLDQILKMIYNPGVLRKKDEILRAICRELSETDLFIIRHSLDGIRYHNAQIAYYENAILKNLFPDEGTLEILMSIPGVGFTIASSIIAEIGDIHQFESPKQLVNGPAWHQRFTNLREILLPCTSPNADRNIFGLR